jgi:hypothetical protein
MRRASAVGKGKDKEKDKDKAPEAKPEAPHAKKVFVYVPVSEGALVCARLTFYCWYHLALVALGRRLERARYCMFVACRYSKGNTASLLFE